MARPHGCTPEVIKRVADGLRLGMHDVHAAARGGISWHTMRAWKIRGEEGEEPFRTFLTECRKAEEQCVEGCLARMHAAARDPRYWKAAHEVLRMRHPQFYGKRVVETQDGGKAPVFDEDVRAMSDAELDAELLEVAKQVRAAQPKAKRRKKPARKPVKANRKR